MKKHFKYLFYVIKHKWYVLVECYKAGIIWQGLIHDLSKFNPVEWLPYVEYFFGERTEETKKDFDYSWNHHQKFNKHHWQYWLLYKDSGKIKELKIPEKYALEMVCDWVGAGKAQGKKEESECKKWYEANKESMLFHPETRKYVESLLIK